MSLLFRCSGSEELCCTSSKPLILPLFARLKVMSGSPRCEEPKKPVPLSKMTKHQLLEESTRLGMTVHPKWTVPELRAVIREHKELIGEDDLKDRMRKINSLNLPELQCKADELGVTYPSKVTKGMLLKLIREHTDTPANTLMTIGRWRGCEYREIPSDYGRWAIQEVSRSANCHTDLVRYARWFQEELETKAAKTKIPDEEVDASYVNYKARTSRGPSSTTSSWETVSATPEKVRSGKGYPKNQVKRNSDDAKGKTEGEMESRPDPAVLEEIYQLETKLAILKDKARSSGQ